MRLSLSISVVFPLCFYLLSGFILKKLNILDSHATEKINSFIYNYLFPINMFKNIVDARDSLTNGEGIDVLVYLLIFAFIEFIILWIFTKSLTKDKKRFGAFMQGVFRGNTMLFALVIAESLLGKGNFGIVAVSAAIFTPLYNVVCITMFEYLRGNKPNILTLSKQIFTNPNIILSLLGFVFIALNLEVPSLLQKPMNDLSYTCTPIAMIVLGADLNLNSVKQNARDLSIGSFLKLILIPALAILIGYKLGFRGEEMVTIFAITTVPSAIACYSTAFKMESDGPFAGEMITVSTLLSIFTVFLWILILPM